MPATMPWFYVGCAGWSIPRQYAEHFPERGTHLERYAQRLPAVEINSSFYRPHRPETYDAEQVLMSAQVARAAADPALVPEAAQPGGWPGLVYYRLHDSPEMYSSTYNETDLDTLTQRLRAAAQAVPNWCIFDNTALGAATANALDLCARLNKLGQDQAVLAGVQPAQTADSHSGDRE